MRTSLILLVILFAYIYGCASGDDGDKYTLVTSQDRKLIAKLCNCVEPLTPLLEKIMNAKDSAQAMIYADSLQAMAMKLEPCIGDAETLEEKSLKNDKFTKQFVEYIREKHPKCLPFFLGVKGTGKEIK